MALETQIQDDMKTAMRAGDALKRDTLRMLIAAMKNERIAVGADLSEDQAQAVIRRGVKSRKDSAQQYRDAGRPELADKEDAEIAILEVYLPQMLDEAATEAAVKAAIDETGATEKCDLGKVMKAVMAAHKGVVDGKLVNQIAGRLLG
ncbi:MAG: GatB/YqeY domain-containing protein [Planctomycetota bacterium]